MRAFVDFKTHSAMRESLDSKRATFTMFSLWLGTIKRDTIAKLNASF